MACPMVIRPKRPPAFIDPSSMGPLDPWRFAEVMAKTGFSVSEVASQLMRKFERITLNRAGAFIRVDQILFGEVPACVFQGFRRAGMPVDVDMVASALALKPIQLAIALKEGGYSQAEAQAAFSPEIVSAVYAQPWCLGHALAQAGLSVAELVPPFGGDWLTMAYPEMPLLAVMACLRSGGYDLGTAALILKDRFPVGASEFGQALRWVANDAAHPRGPGVGMAAALRVACLSAAEAMGYLQVAYPRLTLAQVSTAVTLAYGAAPEAVRYSDETIDLRPLEPQALVTVMARAGYSATEAASASIVAIPGLHFLEELPGALERGFADAGRPLDPDKLFMAMVDAAASSPVGTITPPPPRIEGANLAWALPLRGSQLVVELGAPPEDSPGDRPLVRVFDSNRGSTLLLDATSGKVRGRIPQGRVIAEGYGLLIGADPGGKGLTGYEETGQPVWKIPDGGACAFSGKVLVVAHAGLLAAYDVFSGRVLWELKDAALSGVHPRELACGQGQVVYYSGNPKASLTALDVHTGKPTWTRQAPIPEDPKAGGVWLTIARGTLFVGARQLHCLDMATGSEIAVHPFDLPANMWHVVAAETRNSVFLKCEHAADFVEDFRETRRWFVKRFWQQTREATRRTVGFYGGNIIMFDDVPGGTDVSVLFLAPPGDRGILSERKYALPMTLNQVTQRGEMIYVFGSLRENAEHHYLMAFSLDVTMPQ
ncbi:PQQ-binding-like beta-propeller repeat protein [bacterium]|nr:PQQ-binding-like beta-propeller repeat protein [bacterium]